MRITIKTPMRVSDRDVRALYILIYALDSSSSERMKSANLQYVADRMGYKVVPKS
jgi:hypothetical protein